MNKWEKANFWGHILGYFLISCFIVIISGLQGLFVYGIWNIGFVYFFHTTTLTIWQSLFLGFIIFIIVAILRGGKLK